MKLHVTRGIDGDVMKTLGEVASKDQLWKKICQFKDETKKAREAKVESYDRILKLGEGRLAIDFGDYSLFLLVESDGTEHDAKEVEEFWNPPASGRST